MWCSWYSVLQIPSNNNEIVIDSLSPFSSYQVYLRSRNDPVDVRSETIYFNTSGGFCSHLDFISMVVILVLPEMQTTRITDVIILLFLLLLWCLALSLFFKRWGQTFLSYHNIRLRRCSQARSGT